MLTIGEFGRLAGLTVKALRLYDSLELVVPASVDPYSGRRSYHPDQLERARLVAQLRLVGMPLSQIRAVADAPPPIAARLVRAYWRQVEADAATRARLVSDLVEHLSTKEIPMPQGELTDLAPTLAITTRTGQGSREEQQDRCAHGANWAAVADGFGTAALAELAIAVATRELSADGSPQPTAAAAADAAVRATAATDGEAGADGEAGTDGGTTLTVVSLAGDALTVAHLGDSRCLLLRDGRTQQVTTDHTFVAALVAAGQLDPAEVADHPHRFLLNRALGPGRDDVPDVVTLPVRLGDRVVLSTDGVHAVVPHERLVAVLADPDRGAATRAVAVEIEAAGAPDNWSLVVADVV